MVDYLVLEIKTHKNRDHYLEEVMEPLDRSLAQSQLDHFSAILAPKDPFSETLAVQAYLEVTVIRINRMQKRSKAHYLVMRHLEVYLEIVDPSLDQSRRDRCLETHQNQVNHSLLDLPLFLEIRPIFSQSRMIKRIKMKVMALEKVATAHQRSSLKSIIQPSNSTIKSSKKVPSKK